jgi:hypothetical protein
MPGLGNTRVVARVRPVEVIAMNAPIPKFESDASLLPSGEKRRLIAASISGGHCPSSQQRAKLGALALK